MKAGLQDYKVVPVDEINQSVFIVNSSRPTTGQDMAKRFGFANSFEWAS